MSGRVECWDFDDRSTYEAFVVAARNSGLGTVIDNIEAGYCDDTPGDGVRWLVRYPAEVERTPGSRTVLARRPKLPVERQHDKDNIKVLIELPAFSIVAPTNGRVHPSGRPYLRRKGSFSSIAAYTSEEREALIELARSFDAMPRREADHKAGARTKDNRPGDDFASRTTWTEVLSPHGWTDLFPRDGTTYWRRPGKKFGISATTNHGGADLLYVFTSSTEFEAKKSYTRFGAYAMLNHRGDFQAAARELAKQGYGQQIATSPQAGPRDYRETEAGIEWRRLTKEGVIWTVLTNFSARIVSDITQDDGIETLRALEIAAAINDRAQTFVGAAAQFAQMTWPLEHLGAEAVVQPGQGSKDRARAAIQILSGRIPQRRIYTHTGWRQVDGEMVYMHAGGALGPDGPVDGLEVQLPEQLERYLLPGTDHGLREHVEASLAMRSVASDRVTIPLLAAVYRAAIGEADFSVHISGPTGVQKSEITALGQQHFGATMDARALPGSWTSTGNALEAIASAAKDALLVIDDYVPQGTTSDRARLNAIADRVLRAQGNRSGRGRLRSDATMRRSRPPRGLIVSTGEEVPGGQS